MPPPKNIRALAAARAAAGGRPEVVPELPAALASEPHDGMRRGREVAATYAENLALYAAAIAFGEETRSLHTRVQAMQLLLHLIQEVPETVQPPPEGGR